MNAFDLRQTNFVDVPADWRHLGATETLEIYEALPRLLVLVPHDDANDDAVSADRNAKWIAEFARKVGKVDLVVHVDPLVAQSRDARAAYAQLEKQMIGRCALVGQTLLARAITAFFIGVANFNIEVAAFENREGALDWIKQGRR